MNNFSLKKPRNSTILTLLKASFRFPMPHRPITYKYSEFDTKITKSISFIWTFFLGSLLWNERSMGERGPVKPNPA